MAYPIRVRPQVETELDDAMAWYGARAAGLDRDFYKTFLDVLASIAESPEIYQRIHGEVRRVVFRRFPYAVFYVFDGHEVVVLACLHERRSPERWPLR
ncbi:MAG: type II toxin-antitoxin system RelE/ParE family toxin [Gemmatimonadetes bacterium]|nr:type II toxin-antitoxin system RelE/ParE family toxin [Gemmatimonadota bacterium]